MADARRQAGGADGRDPERFACRGTRTTPSTCGDEVHASCRVCHVHVYQGRPTRFGALYTYTSSSSRHARAPLGRWAQGSNTPPTPRRSVHAFACSPAFRWARLPRRASLHSAPHCGSWSAKLSTRTLLREAGAGRSRTGHVTCVRLTKHGRSSLTTKKRVWTVTVALGSTSRWLGAATGCRSARWGSAWLEVLLASPLLVPVDACAAACNPRAAHLDLVSRTEARRG